jgi:hypothetical protein
MRLLDRIALQRIVSMLLSFILAVLKIFAPTGIENTDTVEPEKKKWRPRWRRKK